MVNFASIVSGAVAASSLLGMAAAHPGEHHDMSHIKRQIDARQMRAAAAKRSLSKCQNSLKHRDLMARSMARRANVMNELRQKRGIQVNSKKFRRDLATLQEFEAVNHNMTGQYDYTSDTSAATIFAANTSCILAPEVTDGPYYVLGEYVRKDVKEDEPGVDMYLEVQYIDVETCEPVQGLFVDIWNCNATGTYSGVESGQGGLDSTFLRGIQETDEDGVVAYETIFPGHYDGRATHTHLLTKSNATLRDNSTTSGGAVTHIGQLFYPEDLITEVEATSPYNTNTVERTTNDEDMWSIVQAEDDYDPIPQFIYLGDSVSDGLLAWIQIGVNSSADYSGDDYYSVAATYYESGGVANAGGIGGGEGPGGNGTGNGTMPTGVIPSGAVPTDLATAGATETATETATTETATSEAATSTADAVAPVPTGVPSGAPPSGMPSGVRPSGGAQPSGRPSSGQQGQQGQQGQNVQQQSGNKNQKQGQAPAGGNVSSKFATSALPTPRPY
ncbi:aromatic compound dioxygenase [Lentithecium fluviatile CBS 122367]|uniref:Aromatic compound dioxygenase n=1 Tax=Lentithecium fluviatile CBS 122367 TaxID=1168545 RepID=A0A6G1JK83_9PLEO|nr:aromatic compound dioxygenase [Lentithecium fluviatile CBS 122367]